MINNKNIQEIVFSDGLKIHYFLWDFVFYKNDIEVNKDNKVSVFGEEEITIDDK